MADIDEINNSIIRGRRKLSEWIATEVSNILDGGLEINNVASDLFNIIESMEFQTSQTDYGEVTQMLYHRLMLLIGNGSGEDYVDMFWGPSSSIPTTQEDVLELINGSYTPEGVSFNTGSYRIFNIVKRSNQELVNATDLDADIYGDVTDSFLYQSSLEINGLDYDILSMVNAIPFTPPHTYKFTLS